jgi:hypothetical protein
MAGAFKEIQRDFDYNKNYGKLSGIVSRYNARVASVEAKKKATEDYVSGKGGDV